jgi:hypothetical protein
MISRGA